MGFLWWGKDKEQDEDAEGKKKQLAEEAQLKKATAPEPREDKKDEEEKAPLPPPIEWEADVDTFLEEVMRLTDHLKRPLKESEFRRLSAQYSTLSQGQRIAVGNALYRLGLMSYTDALVNNDYQRLHKRPEAP